MAFDSRRDHPVNALPRELGNRLSRAAAFFSLARTRNEQRLNPCLNGRVTGKVFPRARLNAKKDFA
jgi:hypothetical protein